MSGFNLIHRKKPSVLAVLLRLLPILWLSVETMAAPVCTTQTVGNQEFRGISGNSDTSIIGVGKKGVIYRYDGAAWNAMPNPGGEDLNDVEVVDDATAFAVGKKGETLQLMAGSWVSHTGFTNQDLFGVWAASATEAWVVGAKGTLYYYDGATWASQKSAAGTGSEMLTDAWGDGSNFYALGSSGTLYRFDRGTGTWSSPDTLCATGNGFEDLWGDSAGNIYLVKRKQVFRHDGTSCSVVANSSENLNGVSGSGNEVFAVGKNGVVLQFDGATWQESVQAGGEINDVWVSGAGNAYYAGKGAAITSCVEVIPVFVVNHDNFGINCLAETITVRVEDTSANPLTTYQEEVTLDTQTGSGTWLLVTGSGSLNDATANDGLATYDWPLGESTAVFSLSYPEGPPSINIDVYQTSNSAIRDNDAEGNIAFSASGFTLSSAPLSNPPPAVITPFNATQIAGTDFGIYLAAFGQTANDPLCGIIESYTGPQNLKFWFNRVDPAGGTIAATIDGSAIGLAEATAANQPVTFTNGQAAITGKYKDAGSIQVFAKDDNLAHPDLPTGIRGATAAFVVKPASFTLSNIEDSGGNPNPAAADASGAVFVAAGDPFSVTVTALDAEGDVTPNYGQENTPETVRLTSSLVDPVAGNDPGLVPALGFGPFAAGSATGTTFTWPEVGIIRLQPSVGDGNYLGGGDVIGLASGNVGRFLPHHFATALNAPLFQTQCVSGGFTYIGESFGFSTAPLITFTALAAGGSTTQNYTGSFFKVTNLSLQNRSYTAASGTLDLSGLPAAIADPVISDTAAGTGTLLFSSGTGISFLRAAAEAPFDADIGLSIDVIDTDGVTTLVTPVTVASIPFDNGRSMRFGRVRLVNSVGSELVNLNVPMRAEYFVDAATGFTAHTDDSCTDGVSLSLSNFKGNLLPGETCVLDTGSPGASGAGCAVAGPAGQRYREPPLGGDFNLFLLAPGAGNDGSTDVTADVPSWLEFDWDAALPGLEDPAGTATFGIYGGDNQRIYTRELY
ncbi:MAG: hypothetical protein OEM50_07600 [Gammaproteobacteria bacterium]|nr:hypothetical protein [Gammaproteobacteria bacterium]